MASSTIANVNGQQSWQISAASVSSFSTTTNAAVNKPEVSFSVNFTNTQPIDLSSPTWPLELETTPSSRLYLIP
jgi:hypothetical protein